MRTRTLVAAALLALAVPAFADVHSATTVLSPLPGTGAFDVTALNPAVMVEGTCAADAAAALRPGEFTFACGVDRDDDGFVTNIDLSTNDWRGFDDDFEVGTSTAGRVTLAVCFREDVDGAFDDVLAFVRPLAGQAMPVGGVTVSIDLAPASPSCDPSDGPGTSWA
jgi:hypothetical protein